MPTHIWLSSPFRKTGGWYFSTPYLLVTLNAKWSEPPRAGGIQSNDITLLGLHGSGGLDSPYAAKWALTQQVRVSMFVLNI